MNVVPLALLGLLMTPGLALAQTPHVVEAHSTDRLEGDVSVFALADLLESADEGLAGCGGKVADGEVRRFEAQLGIEDGAVKTVTGEAPSWQLACLQGQLANRPLEKPQSGRMVVEFSWSQTPEQDRFISYMPLLSSFCCFEPEPGTTAWQDGRVFGYKPNTESTMDPSVLHEVFGKALQGVEARWRAAGAKDGYLTLRLTIHPDGRIALSRVSDNDPGDPALLAWVIEAVESCKAPPSERYWKVYVPILFLKAQGGG